MGIQHCCFQYYVLAMACHPPTAVLTIRTKPQMRPYQSTVQYCISQRIPQRMPQGSTMATGPCRILAGLDIGLRGHGPQSMDGDKGQM